MRSVFLRMLLQACLFFSLRPDAFPADSNATWLRPWLTESACGIGEIERSYRLEAGPLKLRLSELRAVLRAPVGLPADDGFALLREKSVLEDSLRLLEETYDLKMLRFRYRKGIELVKMLYEKILSMDHHFNSMKAQQEMLELSNPHHYPEFREAGEVLENRLKRKYDYSLPMVLQTNPYLSAAFSIVGMVLAGGSSGANKADLENLGCIMDFTVRMHTDMTIVYYETGYLRDANNTLKMDCELLFADCARQVGYQVPLEICRENDDWERLYSLLDNLAPTAAGDRGVPDERLLNRTETNLRFAVERILLFVSRYTDFVNQGSDYYRKFGKIVSGYENETRCAAILPGQFKQLRSDIELTQDKFDNAYRVPEVQGSKLKDMLFGTAEN